MSVSRVGMSSYFTIAARDAYGNEPSDGSTTIRITGTATGNAATSKTNRGGGGVFEAKLSFNGSTYLASYSPPHTGGFSVAADVGGSAGGGSPWVMVSYASLNLSATESAISGRGLTVATAGGTARFTVTARDFLGGELWENVSVHAVCIWDEVCRLKG